MNSEFPAAVHLLVYLAHAPSGTANSEELARSVNTHPARVRKTMGCLRDNGWVRTREGIGGGYSLSAAPSEIRLADVYRAACCDGLRPRKGTGSPESGCAIASGISGAMDHYFGEAERRYLDYFDGVTVQDVLDRIVNGGEPHVR
ncbi:Rrf2 family transcriptional regulator [Saccharibacillus alkalitolerans]|uniref:Rrf2 family transcriptional regulator n=1 Tax=Saccharibacillus alkalitolerans TaxID=2705290 RepID=A0ABX0FDJ4_9BACL|nr:Rrf2 family transcriptional regulator [Saccharibacillus alkalitolerans]NGZ76362.1 Rrf2 family transcriptional regulator [Saccharibacillus alkalitolerans]